MRIVVRYLLATVISLLSIATMQAKTLKVGVAKANITPTSSYFPFKSAHEQYPYVGVHDSLYSRVVVLEEAKERAVVIEIDETSVPRAQELMQKVAKAANTTTDKVMITVSHTHSTLHPDDRDKRLSALVDYIISQTVQATRQAVANMQPATATFYRTQAYANINNGEVSQSNGQYDESEFSDKTLDLIVFNDSDDKAMATMMSYATHAEVMFRSLSHPDGYEVSGDLPGRVATLMEQSDKFGTVILTMPSAEADQQPLFASRQRTLYQGTIDQREGGWAIVDVLAHRITDSALSALNDQQNTAKAEQGLQMLTSSISVPGQNYNHNWQTGENNLQDTDDVSIEIKRLKIGGMQIYAIAADLASEIGFNLRQSAGITHTMIVTNTAGSVGYVLSDKAYEHPGHGVFGSKVKPGYAEKALIQGFNNIK